MQNAECCIPFRQTYRRRVGALLQRISDDENSWADKVKAILISSYYSSSFCLRGHTEAEIATLGGKGNSTKRRTASLKCSLENEWL